MRILLANPRGFCAGVDRAIEIVERALDLFEHERIWVRHEVVHNEFVVTKLRERGAIFTDNLQDIPDGSIVIFSAHGVSQEVRAEAMKRFRVFDATCPLVTKVHMEVARYSREGTECILIGHAGHPEVEGTMGQYDNPNGRVYLVENEKDAEVLQVNNPNNLAYVTQTTLSVDDTDCIIRLLKRRFPNIRDPKREDICYATQNRQDAVKELAKKSEVVIVVGSIKSSNSKRLQELAVRMQREAYLVDNAEQIQYEWVAEKDIVGVTAGASAPEILVQEVIEKLKQWGGTIVEELKGREEKITFALPKELRESRHS